MICPKIGHPNKGAISFTRFVYFQIQNDFILSFLTEFMTASKKRKGGKTRISHRLSPRFLLVNSHNSPPNPQDNVFVMSCHVLLKIKSTLVTIFHTIERISQNDSVYGLTMLLRSRFCRLFLYQS